MNYQDRNSLTSSAKQFGASDDTLELTRRIHIDPARISTQAAIVSGNIALALVAGALIAAILTLIGIDPIWTARLSGLTTGTTLIGMWWRTVSEQQAAK